MNVARSKSSIPLALALLCACGSAHDPSSLPDSPSVVGASDGAAPALETLALAALDPDPRLADPAIASLRAAGPSGLAALLDAHADSVARLRSAPLVADADALAALREDPELLRLRAAIDRVAAQRDAFASGLYWYTDLEEAEAAAAQSGRPILSLRLLGRLDEEASCANSRFFRWLLYPNPLVQQVLAGYVLHWSSERPAPHITIDMGDGRTIERTITGNSVHYVLDASGRVIDAIAGLHTADDFAERLRTAHAIAERCGVRSAERACLTGEHRRLLEDTEAAWSALAGGPDAMLPNWQGLLALDTPAPAAPSAAVAMPLTVGKMSIEMPMLRMMDAALVPTPRPISWAGVARLSSSAPPYDDVISDASRALARLKTGRADDGALLRATYDRAVEDSLQNRFTLDRRLHAWLAAPEIANDLASLNTRVYAELFLTPASDPWLGLRGESDWDVMEVVAPASARP